MKRGLLVKYGEIAIRGRNRYIFENQLIKAIRKNIDDLGDYYITKENGRFFVFNKTGDIDMEKAIERISCIFGIIGLCPCIVGEEKTIEAIEEMVFDYFEENYGNLDKEITFKVETKRADKKFPLLSNDVSILMGEKLINKYPFLKVDIHKPQMKIHIEIRNSVYVYSKIIKGVGGLPQGSSGKGVLLLSGGIDSPVAGYLMEKRGVDLEGVYFHSPPYTSERAKEKVVDLAKRLSHFTGGKRLNIIPFTDIQLYLYDHVPPEKLTLLLKRIMLRIGEKIALKIGGYAIVTGDSVGQVASQTLRSIRAMESAVILPILRPLAGFDKQEIIDIAQQIGTFDISIRPYEDCCTIFVAKHPETKPKANIIESIEKKILEDLEPMMDDAIEKMEIIDL